MYSREYLTRFNEAGVSPLVYLKAIHATEWGNLCERLGVSTESEAWEALQDGGGVACSGEFEVRRWASHRGQTLARTVDTLMSAADAIRLLAQMALELEYSQIEASKAEGLGGGGSEGSIVLLLPILFSLPSGL